MMVHSALETRSATVADAPSIARLVHGCFETYRSFMDAGWEPPELDWQIADLDHRLRGVGVRTRMSCEAGDSEKPVAFCGWMPARTEAEPRDLVPGLAHLWMLFVEREHWGSGLAAELLDWARTGMIAVGYDAARLWTPTGHARARAFYEHRGWRPTGRNHFSPELGLPLVEYRLALE